MPLAKIADLNGPKEEVGELIDLARNLSHFYDEYLDNFVEEDDRAPGIHASELNKCLRMTGYTLTATKKQSSTQRDMRKRFNIGHAIHHMVQTDFKAMCVAKSKVMAQKLANDNGWVVEFEAEVKVNDTQPISKHFNIRSSCDGVFTFRQTPGGEPFLRVGLEIKSASPDSYDKLRGPAIDHVQQTHVYMACLDLPLVWFFYYNKGNQNNTPSSAPWLIPFDHIVWGNLQERAESVLLSVKNKEIPLREEGGHCNWCPYAWTCQPSALARKNTKFISVRRP